MVIQHTHGRNTVIQYSMAILPQSARVPTVHAMAGGAPTLIHTAAYPTHAHPSTAVGAHRVVLEVLEAIRVKSAESLLPTGPVSPSLPQGATLADTEVQLLWQGMDKHMTLWAGICW